MKLGQMIRRYRPQCLVQVGDFRLLFGTPEQKAQLLSPAQRRMVLDSEPDDITGEEGCGVELRGPLYKTAKRLNELKLGTYTHGSPYGDLYCNNTAGLAVRDAIAAGTRRAETAKTGSVPKGCQSGPSGIAQNIGDNHGD
jgi:hypothetical protein